MNEPKRKVGRPKAEPKKVYRIRQTLPDAKVIDANGGDIFIKRVISEAIESIKGTK